MKALICIDYTYDFIGDNNALTTSKNGQQIEHKLANLARIFIIENKAYVAFAIQAHRTEAQYHPENKRFLLQNIIDTDDQKLFDSLHLLYSANQRNPSVDYLTKQYYFTLRITDLYLRLRERQMTEVHLVNVYSDICILHTAIDADNLDYKQIIHEQADTRFDSIGYR